MDTSFNHILPIPSENATTVDRYISDMTSPAVMAFDLALTDGVRRPLLLRIQFTETIDILSVMVTGFTLQAGSDGSVNHTLSGGNFSLIADDTLEIGVLDSDFDAIIAIPGFLRADTASFLSAVDTAVVDTSNNNLVAIPITSGIMVRSYDVDLVAPSLASFSLDMDTGVLSLTWSENVLLDTLVVGFIVIQNDTTRINSYHRITNATVHHTK